MAFNQEKLREDITQRIINAINSGNVPWRRPWSSDPNCGYPRSFVSKKPYRGINPLLLEITAITSGFRSQWWATYHGWRNLGGQVRKGEKGTQIVFYKILEKDELKNDGSHKIKKIFFLRYFTVFNLDQVDGKFDKYRPAEASEAAEIPHDFDTAQKTIAATGAVIRYGGNHAAYIRPSGAAWPKHTDGDYIICPDRQQFPDIRDFYDVHWHELAHWSELRLEWTGSYAMGEIIAEITASLLPPMIGLPISDNMDNHAKYVKSWLKEMKDDPKWIFRASTQAQKVADFILHFSKEIEENDEPQPDTDDEMGAEE
jgi:antirestriction protein ArdC